MNRRVSSLLLVLAAFGFMSCDDSSSKDKDKDKNYCTTDAECVNRTDGLTICNVSANVCIKPECTTHADCSANGDGRLMCNTASHLCVVPPCSTDADCANRPDKQTKCENFFCVHPDACTSSEECAGRDDRKTVCTKGAGFSYCALPNSCAEDSVCAKRDDRLKKCDTSKGVCFDPDACSLDSDCATGHGDKTKCLGLICVTPDTCNEPADCAGRGDGKTVCKSNVCTDPNACTKDTDCATGHGNKTSCHPTNFVCYDPLACTTSNDCKNRKDGKTACSDDTKQCYNPNACSSPNDCVGRTDGLTICDNVQKVCVSPDACKTSKDCENRADDKKSCHPTDFVCYNPEACTKDDDCATGHGDRTKCHDTDKVCVNPDACILDSDCATGHGDKIKCHDTDKVCVNPDACTKDDDCATGHGDKTKCHDTDKVCVNPDACTKDDDCATGHGDKTDCHDTKKICLHPDYCEATTDCASGHGDKTTCKTDINRCVNADYCASSDDCTGRTDDKTFCDLANHVCTENDPDFDELVGANDPRPHFNETTNTLYIYDASDFVNDDEAKDDLVQILDDDNTTYPLHVVVAKDIELGDVDASLANWKSLSADNIEITSIDGTDKRWSYHDPSDHKRKALKEALFSELTNAKVSHQVIDFDVNSDEGVAVFANEVLDSQFDHVVFAGILTASKSNPSGVEYAGGLVADATGSVFTDCYCEDAEINAENYSTAAGLVGTAENCTFRFTDSKAKNSVTSVIAKSTLGTYVGVGGYVGFLECLEGAESCGFYGIVNEVGSITASGNAGGLLGYGINVTIDGVKNTVKTDVSGEGWIGGLVGVAESPFKISNVENTVEKVVGNNSVGGLVGACRCEDDTCETNIDRIKNDVTKVGIDSQYQVVGAIGGLIGYVGEDFSITRVKNHVLEVKVAKSDEYRNIGGLIGICERTELSTKQNVLANIENIATVTAVNDEYEEIATAALVGTISEDDEDNASNVLKLSAIFSMGLVSIDGEIVKDRNFFDDLSLMGDVENHIEACFYSTSFYSIDEEEEGPSADWDGLLDEKILAKKTGIEGTENDSAAIVTAINNAAVNKSGDKKATWSVVKYSYSGEGFDIPGIAW